MANINLDLTLMELADIAFKSGLYQDITSKEHAAMIILAGWEEGIASIDSLGKVRIKNGKTIIVNLEQPADEPKPVAKQEPVKKEEPLKGKLKNMFSIAKANEWETDVLKYFIESVFEIEKSTDMTSEQIDKAVDLIRITKTRDEWHDNYNKALFNQQVLEEGPW